ncbi:AI-2E family transporter [Salinisphaera sp. T31B1]|uniref:AI-2E family transporter n=1 Tax=Salinisphaera sp. T31B1 TaxID=727963 RepID=UPI0033426BF7
MALNDSDHDAESASAPSTRRSKLPGWAVLGLFIYASVFALGAAKNFLVPIVLAFLLAMVFGPVRRFLERRGLHSALASLLIVMTLLIGFTSVVAALAMPVSHWVDKAPSIERQVEDKLAKVSRSLSGVFEAREKIEELAESQTEERAKPVQTVKMQDKGVTVSLAMLAPSVVAQFVFTFVLLLFLLASGDMFYEKLVHVMPTFKDKRRAISIAYTIERKLSNYLMTIVIINAGLGVSVGVGMWLLGMPSPLVFGVIAFTFNFVPYLGALAGILISAAVAMVSFEWIGWAAAAGGVYFLCNAIEGQFVTPYFVGRSLRLNTVVVFVTISFWAWLWSAIGMIVALPLLLALKTFCEHIDELRGVGDFLSERGAERDDHRITDPGD